MSSVSKTILIGNLGADPEQKFMPSGDAVVTFSLATSEKWKDKQSGQPQESTEWHRCVAFGKAAEVISKYAKKGSKLYVEGQNKTRKWQGQDGQDRYTTEIKVREFQLLDSRGGDSGQSPQQQTQDYRGHQGSNQANPTNEQSQGGGFDNFDDDIPFMRLGREHSF